jgi:hypothetical protein
MKNLFIILCILLTASCGGCANTLTVLDGADAACANIEIDGMFTDSRAIGRIMKFPQGTEITAEMIERLCP